MAEDRLVGLLVKDSANVAACRRHRKGLAYECGTKDGTLLLFFKSPGDNMSLQDLKAAAGTIKAKEWKPDPRPTPEPQNLREAPKAEESKEPASEGRRGPPPSSE